MKRLPIISLVCFFALALTVSVEAQDRTVGTYDGGYLIGNPEALPQTTASCPKDSHVCEHTYRKYGPDGLVEEQIYKHCVPRAHSVIEGTYGHKTQYGEWDYRYGPPPIKYLPRYAYRPPVVVVNPPVVYSAPSRYYPDYGDRVIGDTLVGGAFGAAAGAAIGAVVGDPGGGAAIGAVIGGLNSLSRGTVGHGLLW